jgi:hypothetical protein
MEKGCNKQERKAESFPSGYVLILGCSQKKNESRSPSPAIHLYDGVNYRVLRKVLAERGWPPGLQIKILSAKHGLIDATTLIKPYDVRLDEMTAKRINNKTLEELKCIQSPISIFVNLGKDYMPAVRGIQDAFPNSKIIFAHGPIGMKMQSMKRWLYQLRYRTATVKGLSRRQPSYLYFFPDWDDYIYLPFTTEDEAYTRGKKTYAHEAFGEKVPFDGVLLSLSHIRAGKGALHRFGNNIQDRVWLRRRLRLPRDILLVGDCGAFSYVSAPTPPFTPEEAAKLYHKYCFDIGASVDHIPLPAITVRQKDGSSKKEPLSRSTRYRRMYLTRNNAERFLSYWKEQRYSFVPLGVIQGIDAQSYEKRLHEYIDMGYEHIALGGLVPRSDDEVLEILCAVRRALQMRTRGCGNNLWLHLFGILRPKLQSIFRELGVSSIDSASYFRKAWLRSDQNYLAPDGLRWYGTIRIPISSSKPMREAANAAGIADTKLAEMERECLNSIDLYNGSPEADAHILDSIDRYGPLLERKSEDNHFEDKHSLLLKERPWEKCTCPLCRDTGIQVVVFRGASRNKRRGLHNTWVLYNKVLHGGAIPSSSVDSE